MHAAFSVTRLYVSYELCEFRGGLHRYGIREGIQLSVHGVFPDPVAVPGTSKYSHVGSSETKANTTAGML